ncbi:thymidine kinase 2, mitochondrial-like isoform X2 [Gordionus sp. m RMFG-2023]|uniref:thymidine kinase 2, mitochondrial-like isoform X2 n=1 Tax=Gordionus sp. m RMFG-2023 TaxID=3053472 RepID=UPI0031FCE9F0
MIHSKREENQKGRKKMNCHHEPVNKWSNYYGHNMLELYYRDQNRWSFPFQVMVQKTFLDLYDDDKDLPIKIYERSLYASFNVFGKAMKESNFLNDIEYTILTQFYELHCKHLSGKFDLIVYLRLDPEICYQRMTQRARPEEKCVKKEFIYDLHKYYEEWLYDRTVPGFDIPILIVDANINKNQLQILAQDLHSQWVQK